MAHVEIIQNGVVIVKPDPRMKRALQTVRQFLGRIGRVLPGVRSLIRHELILRWLHRELHDFGMRQKYRGKRVYIALDEKVLSGVKDLAGFVKANAKLFVPVDQLEDAMRNAFGVIARAKIRGEWRKKTKRKVQTYGEAWQHRSVPKRK